jgi:pseudaminic acid cytidylyltransferase
MEFPSKRIAIIPARGGSKRIPRKNIKIFSGKPMISYAIKVAIESDLFDHIIVSTDDDEIAEVAVKFGAEVPFMRPLKLSEDDTPTLPVVVDAINSCISQGWDFDAVCCLYSCVPFLHPTDLIESWKILQTSSAHFCIPIVEYPSPIQRALSVNADGRIEPFFPENELTRTQDLINTYHDAGQFYWGSVDSWLTNSRIHSNAVGFQMPHWRITDIDTPDDWHRAELLLRAQV